MNFPAGLFSIEWYAASYLPLLVVCYRGLRLARWDWLKQSAHLNVWLGAVVCLAVLWSMKAGVRPGLNFHLLGATVLTLLCGPHLALLAIALVLAAVTVNGDAAWSAYGLNLLVMGWVPVSIASLLFGVAQRRLPDNFFVFVFINAFFGGALSVLGVGAVASLCLWAGGSYSADVLQSEFILYFLLLGFSEAWLSGMVITLMVVFKPGWVACFDDSRYLLDK